MFARSAETSAHQMTTFTIVSASATYTSFCQRSMASMMVLASAVVHVVDSVMARPGWSRELRAPAPLANRRQSVAVKHSWLLIMRSSRGALPRRRTGGRAYQRIVRELRCADGRLSVL